MFEAIILTIVFLLAIVGLSELLHRIWLFFLRPSGLQNKNYLLIFVDDETAPQQIREGLEKIRWAGQKEFSALVCVDNGMDAKTRNICKIIAQNNNDLIFADINEIGSVCVDRAKQNKYDGHHSRYR